MSLNVTKKCLTKSPLRKSHLLIVKKIPWWYFQNQRIVFEKSQIIISAFRRSKKERYRVQEKNGIQVDCSWIIIWFDFVLSAENERWSNKRSAEKNCVFGKSIK